MKLQTLSQRPSREETRRRILMKADELFRQYGFGKTTVADIAREMKMSSANVYKFFPSKNAIVESCANQNLVIIERTIDDIIEDGGGAMKRIEKCILAIFRFHKELLRNEKQIFKLVVVAMEEGWKCIRGFDEFLYQALVGLVREGMHSKEFRPGDPEKTARALLDSLRVVLHPHLRYGGLHDGSEERVKSQLAFLAKALR